MAPPVAAAYCASSSTSPTTGSPRPTGTSSSGSSTTGSWPSSTRSRPPTARPAGSTSWSAETRTDQPAEHATRTSHPTGSPDMTNANAIKHWAHREAQTYRQGNDRPLSGYLAAMGAYASAVAGLTLLGRGLGLRPPERISPWDVALFGIATHRLTRTMAKDAVVSPV